ncbi:MAG: hypothetical protein ACE5G2_13725, partial [Candidatus Krumholzibacteriia bacterium]
MQNSWNLRRAVLLSAGIHFLTPLLVARCDQVSGWMSPQEVSVPERREPIVFEIVEPPPGPEPEEEPETNLASTRRSLARSEPSPAPGENDLPLSLGGSPIKENRAPSPRETGPAPPQEAKKEGEGERRSLLSPSAIRREVARSVEERRLRNPRGKESLPGDLSFNTVDFEFAPYLLELKRRIEEKWYPPVASFGRGYKGASVIRFAVARS